MLRSGSESEVVHTLDYKRPGQMQWRAPTLRSIESGQLPLPVPRDIEGTFKNKNSTRRRTLSGESPGRDMPGATRAGKGKARRGGHARGGESAWGSLTVRRRPPRRRRGMQRWIVGENPPVCSRTRQRRGATVRR